MRKLGLLAISTVLVAAPVIGVVPSADAAILGKTGHAAILGKTGHAAILGKTGHAAILGKSAILGHSAILGKSAILGQSAILGKSAILGHSAGSVVAKWKNCTVVNRRLPHGVGRATAHDATSGTPVTSFRHDTAMYKAAMRANKSLDRDKDGIACEKR